MLRLKSSVWLDIIDLIEIYNLIKNSKVLNEKEIYDKEDYYKINENKVEEKEIKNKKKVIKILVFL